MTCPADRMPASVRSLCACLALSLAAAAPASAEPAGSYDCLIEPSAVVELASPIVGVVKEMLVDRGDRVARGQIVARLEDGLERARVAVARAKAESNANMELKQARLAFEDRRSARNAPLIASKVVTEKEADEITTAREVAYWELREAEEQVGLERLNLAQAETELAMREVRSPIDGVVIERNREPGESTANEHVLRLARLDPLYVEAFVPAKNIGALVPGMAAVVVPEAGGDQPLAATVKVVDQVADAASGMVKVRLSVPNTEYRELSGLRCTARFDVESVAAGTSPTPAP